MCMCVLLKARENRYDAIQAQFEVRTASVLTHTYSHDEKVLELYLTLLWVTVVTRFSTSYSPPGISQGHKLEVNHYIMRTS